MIEQCNLGIPLAAALLVALLFSGDIMNDRPQGNDHTTRIDKGSVFSLLGHPQQGNMSFNIGKFIFPEEANNNWVDDKRSAEATKSYAAVTKPCLTVSKDVFVHETTPMHPVRMGDFYSVAVLDEFYIKQLARFKFALIGRIMLNKGISPVPVAHLKPILQERWKVRDEWKLVSLGKGFYTLQFSSEWDQKHVASVPVWGFGGGSMRIREWTPGFDPF